MRRVAFASCCLALSAIVATVISAYSASADLTPPPSGTSTDWPKNEYGVTYGSGGEAVSYEDEPDLIKVEATNGKVGYCYRTDLEGPEPSSPAAAVAQQKARGGRSVVIPVYQVDGVTQIGSFVISHDPRLSIEVR